MYQFVSCRKNVVGGLRARRYADEYHERALAMIEKKVEGQEIKAVPPAPRFSGEVVDISAALKKSLETAG